MLEYENTASSRGNLVYPKYGLTLSMSSPISKSDSSFSDIVYNTAKVAFFNNL